MKEKSNATLRRAASLRCRTNAAIDRLGKAVACYQRGAITTAELLEEASAAADRAGTLELSAAELAATGSFGRSVNRKVANYRNYARTAARIAMGYKSNAECRKKALAFARTAARLGNRRTAFIAHDCSGPLPAVCSTKRNSRPSRPARGFEITRLTMARWLRAETPRVSREARNIFEIREASP